MADLVTLQEYKDFAGLQGVQNDARLNTIIDNLLFLHSPFRDIHFANE